MEKEFTFNVARSGNKPPEIYTKKESELNQKEENLLLGNLMTLFINAPKIVRFNFVQKIMDGLKTELHNDNKKIRSK